MQKSKVIFAGLKLAEKYNFNQTATADIFKMLGSILKTDSLPDTRYKIDQIFNSKYNVEFHAVCPNCKRYAGIFNDTDKYKECPVCHKTIKLKSPSYYDFFVIFNISNHIKKLLEKHYDYFITVMIILKTEKVIVIILVILLMEKNTKSLLIVFLITSSFLHLGFSIVTGHQLLLIQNLQYGLFS